MRTRWLLRACALAGVLVAGLSAAGAPALAHGVTDLAVPLLPSLTLQPGISPGGSRPPVPAEPPLEAADRTTPPALLVTPAVVSAAGQTSGGSLPIVVPDAALPWSYRISRELASRFGEAAVADAVRQWDGIRGSRWATAYAGLTDTAAAGPDGESVIFLQDDCDAGVAGLAYWQTSTATVEQRYGTGAWYVTEVDVAVCAAVTAGDTMRQTLAHEIGHAFGLGHFCDPGQACWEPGMGAGSQSCRVMYAWSNPCGRAVTATEHPAAIHLYPRLPRLSGPGRIETAARASYAAFAPGSAARVVLARADGTAHGPLAGAALSGALGAPLLLGLPQADTCTTGAAAEEIARVAAPGGQLVLVGDWPASCEAVLGGWDLDIARIQSSAPVELGVAAAEWLSDTGQLGRTAFIVSAQADARGHVPDGIAAGAAAGAHNAPVLFTDPQRLSEEVRAWLSRHPGIDRLYLLGGRTALSDQVAADVATLQRSVHRVAGSDRVGTAVALASRAELFSGTAVVLATSGSWADAVTGSSTGARNQAPVLVVPPAGHALVEEWIRSRPLRAGFVVGGPAALPFPLQWRYAALAR